MPPASAPLASGSTRSRRRASTRLRLRGVVWSFPAGKRLLTGCAPVQFKDLDIAKLGGPDSPVVREFVIVPKRPTLTIELVSQTGNAFLNGLEIFTTQAPADKPAPGTRSVAPAAPTAPAPVAADAPAPAPAPGPTPGAPLQFTVPEGAVACVPQGTLMGPAGVLDVAPVSVAFGEIDPNDIQVCSVLCCAVLCCAVPCSLPYRISFELRMRGRKRRLLAYCGWHRGTSQVSEVRAVRARAGQL